MEAMTSLHQTDTYVKEMTSHQDFSQEIYASMTRNSDSELDLDSDEFS